MLGESICHQIKTHFASEFSDTLSAFLQRGKALFQKEYPSYQTKS